MARAGKLLSRHVAPGSGLGMSLIGAMSLVLNVVPPLWETAKATASPLPVVASNVTYTVPSLPTTTVALSSLVNTFETLFGTDQVFVVEDPLARDRGRLHDEVGGPGAAAVSGAADPDRVRRVGAVEGDVGVPERAVGAGRDRRVARRLIRARRGRVGPDQPWD